MILLALLIGLPAQAATNVDTRTVNYKAGDTELRGYLAYDGEQEQPRPAVLVVPEWWGLNDYARRRARELAELGYVALAVDMYGDGKATADPEQAGVWASQISKNPGLGRARFMAALQALQGQQGVDPERVAGIGYCFGGTMVLNMARVGAELDGVVSFHGTLPVDGPPAPEQIQAEVLLLHGGADSYVTATQIADFKRQMQHAGADFDIITYPGAKHSFTNPAADAVAQKYDLDVGYDAQAEQQSWLEMRTFLVRVLGY
ncbi:MAG: dienelactone hydrolase family protein [Gammaproteobacteria bacterium]|nr:dienelactone hydrolase family protein [Gammaproteobacteria bacterium]